MASVKISFGRLKIIKLQDKLDRPKQAKRPCFSDKMDVKENLSVILQIHRTGRIISMSESNRRSPWEKQCLNFSKFSYLTASILRVGAQVLV